MVLPFILGAVGDMDLHGEMISCAIAMQMTGLDFGPFLAARIPGEGGGFVAAELMTIIPPVVSFFILMTPMLSHRRALNSLAVGAHES